MVRARSRIEDHHAEWLSLVETSGPFLTIPTLKRALPDGLDPTPAAIGDLRIAYAEWEENPDALQRRWVQWVLEELLDLRDAVAEATEADPSHMVAEQGVTLRPSFVVRDHTQDGRPAVLLVNAVASLTQAPADDAWSATAVDRAVELAKATNIPLALVTDGMRWTLVWAREGETTGTCTWRADLWLEEQITLRAFTTLLGGQRFFNLPVEESLARLLDESASKQQEVADQLGAQVRRAVELLIATLDREDRDRHGELLQHLESAEVYRGATTVMMRLVFLFVAEERRLLPIDDPLYAETLAASTLRAQLQERADRDGEDPLERSTAAWHRVLALFRAVHSGIEHDALRLPAYGGGLFDPDRYPFLEGRTATSSWQSGGADPLPVDDRTMLHLLDALQTLEQGGARVLLSYRALDVEQIGHVYEGLLDHTAVRITDAALGLVGKHEPELALGQLDEWADAGSDVLVEQLAKETGKSGGAISKALRAPLADERRSRLSAVCGTDDALLDRVAPYHALLREDLRGDPLVFLAGSLFVTQALDRRASGTYYTPRQLAEEVVQHALDPVAYNPGPAEERDPAKWKLKAADELLDLKVADIAMGSGAFLVAACRYLAARLQEAWSHSDAKPSRSGGREGLPADPEERAALAHRLVAERCLYGVDKNPMAVEMAKLSLWLITLAKNRPFSFVDHALRTGDSLLGVTDLAQLRVAHLDPKWPRQASLDLGYAEIETAVDRALMLRRDLEAFVVRDIPDAEQKSTLLAAADDALDSARLLGDLVVGAANSQIDDADPIGAAEVAAKVRVMLDHHGDPGGRRIARSELRRLADDWLTERRRTPSDVGEVAWAQRYPFHWAIEFPEGTTQGGFDAIVGNPPFQGGTMISGALGGQYRDYLANWLGQRSTGRADLVAFFFLRASTLLAPNGCFGLIATNTLAQGDTREVGLDQILAAGFTVFRAVASAPWPGGANLEMATVWARRRWEGAVQLDSAPATSITSSLAPSGRVEGLAHRLRESAGHCFQGYQALSQGFVLTPADAAELLRDPRSRDVVRPYLSGEDLSQRPDMSASRWAVDFGERSLEEAQSYTGPFATVAQRVMPERQGKDPQKYPRLVNEWWKFWRTRGELRKALEPLERCIAMTIHSKVVLPCVVDVGLSFTHGLVVFAYDDDEHFGLLSSGFHWWWAVTHASTMRTDIRYTPTDCFETFAHPEMTSSVGDVGVRLNEHRTALMLDRQEGLTKTYNRVHDPDEAADDIVRLRELHVELDHAVRDAYGWSDLDLGHDFQETKFGTRYTFAPVPRQEVLDRLLELNHERYAEEVRRGLHKKGKAKRKAAPVGAITMGFEDG